MIDVSTMELWFATGREHPQDFADLADIEFLCIDKGTQWRPFRNELRWNAAAYR